MVPFRSLLSHPKGVNIINSRPKAVFSKWPSKIEQGSPKDSWLAKTLIDIIVVQSLFLQHDLYAS